MAQANQGGGSKPTRWEKLREYGVKGLDYLDRPSKALRAGIGAFQEDTPILPAMKEQILNSDAPVAPSGAELADRFGEQYDIQNPYALAAVATAADMADPLALVPGGAVAKVGRKAADRAMKVAKEADTAKDLLTRSDDFGKVIVKDTPSTKGLGKVRMRDDEILAQNKALLEKNPQLKEMLDSPKYKDDPRFDQVRKKLGMKEKAYGRLKRTGARQVREGLRYGKDEE